jgi:hypothetical protein
MGSLYLFPYFLRPILVRESSCFSPGSCSPVNFGPGNRLASDEVGAAGASLEILYLKITAESLCNKGPRKQIG